MSPRSCLSRLFPARLRVGLLSLLLVTGLPAAVQAQAAQGQSTQSQSAQVPNSLPNNVRTAADAGSARGQIDAFIDAHLARITGNDPAAASQSRDALASQVVSPDASSSFKELYASRLSQKLPGALSNASPFAKLNLAIVNARVARYTGSAELEALTRRLAQDDSAPVALWGLKAAQYVLPSTLATQIGAQQNQLVPTIVSVVRKFPRNGPIAEEAYTALLLDLGDLRSSTPRNVITNGVPLTLPATHELMAFRQQQYTAQGGVPAEPMAEEVALLLLTHPAVWELQNAEQRRDTLVRLRDLLLQIRETASAHQGRDREALIALATRIGAAFEAISNTLQNGPAAQQLERAAQGVRRLPTRSLQSEVDRYVNELERAITASFPELPAPQVVDVTAQAPAATAPADAPADAPAEPAGTPPQPATPNVNQ